MSDVAQKTPSGTPPRRVVVAVTGPRACHDEQAALARAVGQALAARGAVVLCTGNEGITGAASAGARAAGGLTIALLPGTNARESPPGEGVELALFTGLGEARAAVAISSCDGLIAIGGGFGTLGEIGLALRARKPLVLLDSWRFEMDDVKPQVPRAESADDAVDLVMTAIAAAG